ncbi:MAG TPA: HlyD family efflux transporter periplasmic adaptor subunit [Gemmatimonadales bacterium]|nr:HlyD family efflux transporter periplasmic adaptor subunit [Gemmatimonadales bacterium]
MKGVALGLLLLPALACGVADDGAIARGTVELREYDVAPAAAARVVSVRVDEGDAVRAGDTLAVLTLADAGPQLAQQAARVEAARAAVADLRAGARSAEIARARAEVSAADAEAVRTSRDLARAQRLSSEGVIARRELDDATAAARVAGERRDAAQASLRLLQSGARDQQVRAAEAELRAAEAARAGTQQRLGDLVLTAPVDGVVLSRHAEPGEVMPAGGSVLRVGDAAHPWVRAFVSQDQLAAVRVGERLRVTPEGWNESVGGSVQAIDAEAQFTPRVALTADERSDLMFGVRIALDSALPAGVWVVVRRESAASE